MTITDIPDIQTGCNILAQDVNYWRIGQAVGRRKLLRLGFAECQNDGYYLRRDNVYAHYNRYSKAFFFEEARS